MAAIKHDHELGVERETRFPRGSHVLPRGHDTALLEASAVLTLSPLTPRNRASRGRFGEGSTSAP